MTSDSSISTLEIRKEGISRFYLCVEWTSTFKRSYYMVLTLMELESHMVTAMTIIIQDKTMNGHLAVVLMLWLLPKL